MWQPSPRAGQRLTPWIALGKLLDLTFDDFHSCFRIPAADWDQSIVRVVFQRKEDLSNRLG
ncbi:MAG: hypothetical protein KTR27_06205 [Leptolyngbyaceae cyanobacterium MAG.088]|nr:hypothetical protein [Leptolyngbyaceae cyanobacterium MAG.088]